jgi:hypothetical protein
LCCHRDEGLSALKDVGDGHLEIPSHPHTLSSMNALAMLYKNEHKYAQAEPLSLMAVEGYRRVLGAEHPETLTAESNLAILYYDLGR